MTRADKVLAVTAIVALLALALVGADDLHQRGITDPLKRKVERAHKASVDGCKLNDDPEVECEARWLRETE